MITGIGLAVSYNIQQGYSTRCRSGGSETICPPPPPMQFDPKIVADLRPSMDRSAVRTSLVSGVAKLQAASVPIA